MLAFFSEISESLPFIRWHEVVSPSLGTDLHMSSLVFNHAFVVILYIAIYYASYCQCYTYIEAILGAILRSLQV